MSPPFTRNPSPSPDAESNNGSEESCLPTSAPRPSGDPHSAHMVKRRTVIVENLENVSSLSVGSVAELFADCGQVVSVRVSHGAASIDEDRTCKTAAQMGGDVTFSNRVHALVEFSTPEEAITAIERKNDGSSWRAPSGLRVRHVIYPFGKLSPWGLPTTEDRLRPTDRRSNESSVSMQSTSDRMSLGSNASARRRRSGAADPLNGAAAAPRWPSSMSRVASCSELTRRGSQSSAASGRPSPQPASPHPAAHMHVAGVPTCLLSHSRGAAGEGGGPSSPPRTQPDEAACLSDGDDGGRKASRRRRRRRGGRASQQSFERAPLQEGRPSSVDSRTSECPQPLAGRSSGTWLRETAPTGGSH